MLIVIICYFLWKKVDYHKRALICRPELISNLERNGYLRRESLDSDRRYKKLVLTAQTLAIKDDITSRINEYMHSMFVGISEDDLKVFEKVIMQMTANTK